MAGEIDRQLLPSLVQTTFNISLGACYKSVEVMKNPRDSVTTMVVGVIEMTGISLDSGEGLQRKAEALTGFWVSKSMDLLQTCKTAGEQFTEAR